MGKGNSYAELYRQMESSGYEDKCLGTMEGTRAESREKFKATKTFPLVTCIALMNMVV